MTVASMTGFARGDGEVSQRLAVTVVVRSVNHRHLDVAVRHDLPGESPELEAAVRTAVSSVVSRGRVSVNLRFTVAPSEGAVRVDGDLLRELAEQLRALDLPSVAPPTVGDLLAVPGAVRPVGRDDLPSAAEVEAVEAVVRSTTFAFDRERRIEGAALEEQIRDELDRIEAFLDWLEPRSGEFRDRLFERLRERIASLLPDDVTVPEERLLHEAALQADRWDVAEEIVRLRSHLDGFRRRLEADEPVGRTLDFLCQELVRELNTIGSKLREEGVAERLVDAKGAVERIREQVQNIE